MLYSLDFRNDFCVVIYLNSGEILNKLKSRGFLASSLSTYDFSTLYTTLPHILIKVKLTYLIEQTFNSESSIYLVCNDNMPVLLLNNLKDISCGNVRKCLNALHFLMSNLFIRFGLKLYRKIAGGSMGTSCAPLVADMFLICYKRDFMLSLSDNNQTDII